MLEVNQICKRMRKKIEGFPRCKAEELKLLDTFSSTELCEMSKQADRNFYPPQTLAMITMPAE